MVGVFLMLFRERGREKSIKKSSSSPASHVQGMKKTHSAIQNGTVWIFLFFFYVNSALNNAVLAKTRRFI
jgi:hypothetical protein